MLPAAKRVDQWIDNLGLPPLSEEERASGAALGERIRGEIDASGGRIPFRRFMELALYAPGLGYYTGRKRKFGNSGDFVTAPEISPLFGRCIARQCAQVFEQSGGSTILEFGAGSGKLAADLIAELQHLGHPPQRYLILEVSPDLRMLQQETLRQHLPDWEDRIEWLDRLPSRIDGVILANEVVDAMPVHLFRIAEGAAQEAYVTWRDAAFALEWVPEPADDLAHEVANLAIELADGYRSEINLVANAWIHELAGILGKGMALIIDYGHTRAEYYHAERNAGTLLCHFRHRAHNDPLILPGLQDITAHVDFSALANAALTAGLTVSGYATQGNFLINAGLDDLLHRLSSEDSHAFLRQIQQVKALTLPSQMGERFKVLALTKGLHDDFIGFQRMDQRHKL